MLTGLPFRLFDCLRFEALSARFTSSSGGFGASDRACLTRPLPEVGGGASSKGKEALAGALPSI
jgi:hypothetical protein